ncbi:MAG: efflux RND transporter periplasmic adaptor subunit [Candidatus Marinimicrobia bacterium]|nr:efflux RND transporter periplasmic adaptor subunit [Candidatus Neomarinimicrobiota bacterium]
MKIDLKLLKTKPVLIGIGVVAVLALIIVKNTGRDDNPEARPKGPPIAVQVEKVTRQMVEQTVTAAGKIRPVFETEISSNVGAQIMDLYVKEGDKVEAGDLLVSLDRARYEAAYERAKSALRSARANEKKIKAEIDRGRQLYEKNLISLQDMEALEASYESALSQSEQAAAMLEQAKDDLNKTELIAPDGGVVTKLNKEIGEMALGSTFQADVLLIISDLTSMEIVVDVDETDVVDVALLDPVEIEIDAIPDTIFSGRVSRVAHSATILGLGTQEQATNFEVIVTLDINLEGGVIDSRIRPGMSATATIITARHDSVLAVPIQALAARPPVMKKPEGEDAESDSTDQDNKSARRGKGKRPDPEKGNRGGKRMDKPEPVEVVFVVKSDSAKSEVGFFTKLFGGKAKEEVEQRPVKLGISSDTHYEILSGLSEDEEIVIGNYRAVSRELQDGSLIKRREMGGPEGNRRQSQ